MIKLWNQTMPHRCVEDAFEPYLTPYDCDAAKTAIVVCPGGAYCGRADYEGNDVGAWLNTIGITAFVLEYRVAPSKAPAQPSDARRAMRLARKLCMERGIERLGIMGFSAGGHLAATLSVHYDEAFYPPQDELDNLSACPDFTVLCYSVIDMGEYRHDWSRRFLLGDVPDEAQIEFYSPQRCVTENTPPAFLWHTAQDASVPAINKLEAGHIRTLYVCDKHIRNFALSQPLQHIFRFGFSTNHFKAQRIKINAVNYIDAVDQIRI